MITIFLVILSLVAVLWLWLLLSPAHRASLRFVLDSDTPVLSDQPLPRVTIIVPARNEEKILGQSIPSMCRQDYSDLRVVLVDDQSDDDSPDVIARLRVEHANLDVISGRERPQGWCGKPWAVQQGFDHAVATRPKADQWFLFTDADCIFHPQAVRQAMLHARERGLDLISLFPSVTFSSTIERIGVVGLVTVLLTMFPLGWANDPKRALTLTAGAFMLVRRSAYETAGGHAAVRAHIIEDVNLGKYIKAAGARVEARFTRDLIRTEMYESVDEMWEGLAKNAYAGMEYQPTKFWAGLLAGTLSAVLPPAYLVASLIWAIRSPGAAAWTAVALSTLINLCILAIHARTVRFMRAPWYDTFLLPASALLYNMIALTSMWQHHFAGGNVWKGRRYDRRMLLQSLPADDGNA